MNLTAAGSFLPTDATSWVAGLAVLATFYVYMRARRKTRDPLSRRAPGAPLTLGQQREVEQRMSDLLVELTDMARQMSAQLDNRSQRLEILLREADDKIASLQGQLQSSTPPPPALRLTTDTDTPPPDPTPPADPRHAAVYAMADAGKSAGDIARSVGKPAGEVELILALRRRG